MPLKPRIYRSVTENKTFTTPEKPENYASPLLQRRGAVAALPEDPQLAAVDCRGVAWHYGAPLEEQRALDRGPIVVDRSHRTVLAITGEDAPGFLNNLLSQKLDDLHPGDTAAALDLDIQGRIIHHMRISLIGETFYIDTPATQGATLLDFLTKMIFWSKVEIKPTDLGMLTVLGTTDEIDVATSGFSRVVEWQGIPRRDYFVPRAELTAAVRALETGGCSLAGLMAYTAERVKALEPELEADLDAKAIPHEIPHLIGRGARVGAVHLEKGCYRGQETVARVENLGRSPRLLVLLHLDGSAPDESIPGSDITAAGAKRAVGRIGTVVHDVDYGPIALALIKRSALHTPGLAVGNVAVAVDNDSIAADEQSHAGRDAIAKLRGTTPRD